MSNHPLADTIEGIFLKFNFRKSKWLLFGPYHTPSQRDDFENAGRALDIYNNFDKVLIAGDLNAKEEKSVLSDFFDLYDLRNLAKENTYFRSRLNPIFIDIFIANCNKNH